ncbi:MAG: serine hydrolase [Bacteroidetes bacterium]|nr:serine hydrolase [Bacteroidota bacterium]
MKSKLLLILVSVFFLSTSVFAQFPSVYKARLDFVFDSVCNAHNIKGAAANVLIPNVGVWNGVHGISEVGVPITKSMLFPIGSNTKTYTAVMILKLQELGLLSINDTIGTWFPGNPNIPGKITIKQLLRHQSGLYDYFNSNPATFDSLNADFTRTWQPTEMFQFIKAPIANPGGAFNYCNTNYLLAGLIIEQVTGLSYHMALRNYIFTPFNLQHTITPPFETTLDTIPNGWTADIMGYQEDMQVNYGWSNNAFLSMASAAGAICATAEDLSWFWDNLMHSQTILNASSLNDMKQFIFSGSGSSYGLGLFRFTNFYAGKTVYSHGGTCFGYISENLFEPTTNVSVSVLTNQDSVSNNAILVSSVRGLFKESLGMLSIPAFVNNYTNDEQLLVYPNPAGDVVNIEFNENGLHAVSVMDISGAVVFETQASSNYVIVETSKFANGIYQLLTIDNSSGRRKTTKLVVAR